MQVRPKKKKIAINKIIINKKEEISKNHFLLISMQMSRITTNLSDCDCACVIAPFTALLPTQQLVLMFMYTDITYENTHKYVCMYI